MQVDCTKYRQLWKCFAARFAIVMEVLFYFAVNNKSDTTVCF